MSFTHTIATSYTTPAGLVTNTSTNYTGTAEIGEEIVIAANATNQEIDLQWYSGSVQAQVVYAKSAGLTIKTNSTGSPNDTVVLAAGQQIAWGNDHPEANPIIGLQVAAPGTVTPTPSSTGGTIPAGTYYYKVTALGLGGETVGSPETSGQVLTGATSSVALAWSAVTNATSYKIYRGTSSGAESIYFTSATNSFTDTNAGSTAGTVPTKNTTGSISKLFVTNASSTTAATLEIRAVINI